MWPSGALVQLTFDQQFFLKRNNPQRAKISPLSRLHDNTQTHHTLQDYSGQVISSLQTNLHNNTQHSKLRAIHTSAGFEPAIQQARGRVPTFFMPFTANEFQKAVQ